MILLLQYTIIFASVLLLVALGGCFSERSGVINIGLEGIMVMGALGGALVMKYMSPEAGALAVVSLTVVASALFGLLFSLLLAVASITFKADQTIIGTAMNMIAVAAATVIVKAINTAASGGNDVSSDIAYTHTKELFVVRFGSFEFNWFMLIALVCLVIAYIVLYKTRFGLRLRSCGEHPQASASVGINVFKMRYAGVLISGLLGGIGGIVYITAGVSLWKFEVGVAGFGFLAMAVMIFGAWHPLKIAAAALLFGFLRALGNVYSGFDFLANMNIPSVVYNMLPYVISLVVLAFTSKKSRAPKAVGQPYEKGSR
ncbi:MAG: ABC transporter permease [Clostridia bacterium]|nr:ABC transporter permease [Clostridia bacterium]